MAFYDDEQYYWCVRGNRKTAGVPGVQGAGVPGTDGIINNPLTPKTTKTLNLDGLYLPIVTLGVTHTP